MMPGSNLKILTYLFLSFCCALQAGEVFQLQPDSDWQIDEVDEAAIETAAVRATGRVTLRDQDPRKNIARLTVTYTDSTSNPPCLGFLLDRQYVLTAEECLLYFDKKKSIDKIKVRLPFASKKEHYAQRYTIDNFGNTEGDQGYGLLKLYTEVVDIYPVASFPPYQHRRLFAQGYDNKYNLRATLVTYGERLLYGKFENDSSVTTEYWRPMVYSELPYPVLRTKKDVEKGLVATPASYKPVGSGLVIASVDFDPAYMQGGVFYKEDEEEKPKPGPYYLLGLSVNWFDIMYMDEKVWRSISKSIHQLK